MPYALLAAWLTARGSSRPVQPDADACEWSGRVFATLIVLAGIATNFVNTAGY
jgi:hypothetical protein